jgi:type II secretory pathway component PulJ
MNHHRTSHPDAKGMTLVEVLLAVVLTATVALAATHFVGSVADAWEADGDTRDEATDVTAATAVTRPTRRLIAREINRAIDIGFAGGIDAGTGLLVFWASDDSGPVPGDGIAQAGELRVIQVCDTQHRLKLWLARPSTELDAAQAVAAAEAVDIDNPTAVVDAVSRAGFASVDITPTDHAITGGGFEVVVRDDGEPRAVRFKLTTDSNPSTHYGVLLCRK